MGDGMGLDSFQTLAASFGASFEAEKVVDTVMEKNGCRYYKVRWVKHSWEPATSFGHLEHLIHDFWKSVGQNSSNGTPTGKGSTKDFGHNVNLDQSKIPQRNVIQHTIPGTHHFSSSLSHIQNVVSNDHISAQEIPAMMHEQNVLQQGSNFSTEEILKTLQEMTIPMDQNKQAPQQQSQATQAKPKKAVKRKRKQPQPAAEGDGNAAAPPTKTVTKRRPRVEGPNGEKERRKIPGNCPICGKYFKSTTNIAAHKKLHTEERQFSCEQCGKRFRRKLHLNRHLDSHAGLKPYQCDICGSCFSSKWYLKAHAVIHTGSKPFACEVCDKKFNNKANLSKHKLIHINKRPYVCNQCGRSYRQNCDLRRHFNTHLKEKNKKFQCTICLKRFSKNVYLKRHMNRHANSVSQSLSCKKCLKEFETEAFLREHNKICTAPEPPSTDEKVEKSEEGEKETTIETNEVEKEVTIEVSEVSESNKENSGDESTSSKAPANEENLEHSLKFNIKDIL